MSGRRASLLRRPPSLVLWQVIALLAFLALLVSAVALLSTPRPASPGSALASNDTLDGGTPLHGRAPGFRLTDQLGHRVSLSSFRGRAVLLAFNDSQCTTTCPLTTTEMVYAKKMLGAAGSSVALVGIDANPTATAVRNVRAYSEVHGMMHTWQFLTGSLAELRRVWHAYHVDVQIEHGAIDHTPPLYLISPAGSLAKVYGVELAYASTQQQAQLLAEGISALLPGRPAVHSTLSYARIPSLGPSSAVSLPRAGGGSVSLGPSGSARLLLFFDTWDSETMNLAAELEGLDHYASTASTAGLPALTAVDEASVEPSERALPDFLRALARPLSFPVAIDKSGRVADGYHVEDEPWLELVSSSGGTLWYYDLGASGPLSGDSLVRQVRAALTRAPEAPASVAAALRELAGSPPALQSLHEQADELVGTQSALAARLHALRGYPVVLNVWASWCTPCRSEFPLFASASARYGRQVAFLGADAEDQAGNARAFLAQHPVSYPSYETSTEALSSLAAVPGLPTTIFLNRSGKVAHLHIGQYGAQGTLDEDINAYALAG